MQVRGGLLKLPERLCSGRRVRANAFGQMGSGKYDRANPEFRR